MTGNNSAAPRVESSSVLVSLVSCAELSDKNGVVSFMRAFAEFEASFNSRGVIIKSLCGADLSEEKAGGASPVVPNGKSRGVKTLVRNAVKGCSLGALFLIYFSYMRRAKRAYKCYLAMGRSDVVFFQDIFCFYVALKDVEFREKSIVIFHSGSDVLEQLRILFPGAKHGLAKYYIEKILKSSLRRSDIIVTLSNSYRDYYNSIFRSRKFFSVYNTSSLDFNSVSPVDSINSMRVDGRINLVCVGSAQFRKGYDLLISAIASLSPSNRECIFLHIAGDGDQLRCLQDLCESVGVTSNIRFHGAVENPTNLYNAADIFCLPSRDEGLSISLIEAMGFGLPVFATPVGSIDEIFPANEYIRVDVSIDSMKDALEVIIDGGFDLDFLGGNSKRIFHEKLSPAKFVDNYSGIIRGLV